MPDKFKDECGVIGIYAPEHENVAQLLYYGLYALQHRGQESAGIAVCHSTGETKHHKAMGLVSEVFDDDVITNLSGNIGIGHVRYSTTGQSFLANAQPLVVRSKFGDLALAHNGNLVNAQSIRNLLEDEGVLFQTTIDTEVIANMLSRYNKKGIVESLRKVSEIVKGAFSMVIMSEGKLIAIKDNFGFRPLCIGKYNGSFVIASETCALDTIGADFIREIEAGEIVVIDKDGIQSYKSDHWCQPSACIFELIYFARPDSYLDGINANSYRYKCGRILAKESFVEADRVIAVPDSGIPSAIGFAEESGIPYGVGLIKNRYIGRTFIQPDQKLREQGVRIKLNVLRKNVEGKRVVLVDDSIVRGTTSKQLVQLLRKAGAKEVHMRISSPPVVNPCHFGIDTPTRDQLIGANHSIEEICKILEADTLAYLSIDGAQQATGRTDGFCKACFDGKYPMEVPKEGNKMTFEK